MRPHTMGGYQRQETAPLASRSTTFDDGRWMPRFPGGETRNTKHERQPVVHKATQVKKPKREQGETFPASFPPVKEQPKSPPPARGSPPPAHGVIPAGRSQLPDTRGNDRVTHPLLRMPDTEGGNREREVLPPYTQIGADGATTCRRRPRQLTTEANFAIMTRVSENVRKRAECATQREEARSLRMGLRYPTPDDPFDPY